MKKKHEPIFDWSEDNNMVWCTIEDAEGHIGMGCATCHENDQDMRSQRTGEEIAYRRARINLWRELRDELKLQVKTLNHFASTINHSKKFNPKSYENLMLQRQLRQLNFDLDTIKELIASEYQSLCEYLQNKDKFYQRIRANRTKAIDN